jgi:ADP-heptose:LPS heptosyltransferase
LSALFRPQRLQLAESLPLAQLARRLQACAGFIGHDSGITHLATAVGVPALILWSETRETIWRPRGKRVTVLRSPQGVEGLSTERVQQAADSMFKA